MKHKILYAVIIIGIAARLFSLFLMPEEAYNDALFHLMVTERIAETGTLGAIPPPLYYFLNALTFQISTKLLPTILSLLQVLLSYFIMRELFGARSTKALIGTAFVACFPLLIRFGAVNYVDNLVVVLMLFCFYFLLALRKQERYALPLAVSIGMLALTKLTGLLLAPVFIIAGFWILIKERRSVLDAFPFIVVALILSFSWAGSNLIQYGSIDRADFTNGIPATAGFSPELLLPNLHLYYLYLFDFPNLWSFNTVIPNLELNPLMFVFGLMVLPMFLAMLYGFNKILKENRLLAFVIGSICLLSIGLVIYREFYVRFFMPMIPFAGVLLAYGSGLFKRAVVFSLLLFSLYALLFTGFLSYYYSGVYQNHAPLYSAISELPASSNIMIQPTKEKSIEYYAGRKATPFQNYNGIVPNFKSPDEACEAVKDYSHVAKVCYREVWGEKLITEMPCLNLIYHDTCGYLYRVRKN